MEEILELITETAKEGEGTEYRLGIRIKVGGHETVFPLTPPCRSYRAFEEEIEKIRGSLEELSRRVKTLYEAPSLEKSFGIEPHMSAKEIWSILCSIPGEEVFVTTFNTLEEAKRRETAEHVLTKCNVFSGRASVFSSRYSEETALME